VVATPALLGEVDLVNVGRSGLAAAACVRGRRGVVEHGPLGDEGPASLGGIGEPICGELLERQPDGGSGNAVLLDQLRLAGHSITRLEISGADAVAQVVGDLPPQGNTAGGIEGGHRGPCSRSSRLGCLG
jgi:hypothetical protein